MMLNHFFLCVFLFTNFLSIKVFAEEDQHSHHQAETIQVLGSSSNSSLFDIVPSVTVLSGDLLFEKRANSLGEMLNKEVGINSSSYGPAASRPIIRGLEGDRIRILQDGLGILDASGASQDHAISIDPLAMDKVEIVRGPLSLLYGSNAIGGVVNIVTNRTHTQLEKGSSSAVDTKFSSVDNGKSLSIKSDYGVDQWMFHLDAGVRDSQDLKIKDFARSQLRRDEDPLPIQDEVRDKLTNSSSEALSGAVGATRFIKKGFIGVSASTFTSKYGVIAEEDVTIDMNQSRFDFVTELKDVLGFKKVRFKTAQSIYKHQELDGSEVGTSFKNNGNEARLEFIQNSTSNLEGQFGIQTNIFTFSAAGNEAYLPKTNNQALALFVFEELKLNETSKINSGLRVESNSVDPTAQGAFLENNKQSFNLMSFGLGYLIDLNQNFKFSAQGSYNERAPNYQELFADGAHIATFSYEVGDSNLDKEKAVALDLSLRFKDKKKSAVFTVFGQHFNNYVFLNPTGTFDDTDESGTPDVGPEDLQIYNYVSDTAAIYGFEFEGRIESVLNQIPGQTNLFVNADYLRGQNTSDNSDLPRITPPRVLLGVNYKYKNLNSDLELQRVFKQTNIATNELPTDAYTQVNLGLSYDMNATYNLEQLSIFLRANNIFNVEARNHSSILKDVAQLGGRNISLGVRAYF